MAILRYISPILLAAMLSGCYENFNPEIDTKPVLCLNSLIKAGDPIEVEVTHTWVFNDEAESKKVCHEVEDARVVIEANGEIVGSDYLPREGDRIRITAESRAYGMATAEVTVPRAVPIGRVKVTPVPLEIWNGSIDDSLHYHMLGSLKFGLNIEMDVCDPADARNYYLLEYNEWGEFGESNILVGSLVAELYLGDIQYDAEPIFGEHVGVFETAMGNGDAVDVTMFTDTQFQGGTYTLNLKFANCMYRVTSRDYDEDLLDCGVTLCLNSVTKSYYDWLVYRWNVEEGIVGEMADVGFAEPHWGYSNVSTGAGVVAAQSSAYYTINLSSFLKQIFENEP